MLSIGLVHLFQKKEKKEKKNMLSIDSFQLPIVASINILLLYCLEYYSVTYVAVFLDHMTDGGREGFISDRSIDSLH